MQKNHAILYFALSWFLHNFEHQYKFSDLFYFKSQFSIMVTNSVPSKVISTPPPMRSLTSKRRTASNAGLHSSDVQSTECDLRYTVPVNTWRYNNNNNRIQKCNLRFFTISLLHRDLSPTRTLKWPGHIRVQITYNTLSAYHVQHVRATRNEGIAQLLSLTV